MSRDFIKLQEIAELKDALKIKEINEELLEHLQSSILHILDYADKQQIPLPNLDRIENSITRANQIIQLLQNGGHLPPTNRTTNEEQPDSEHNQHSGSIRLVGFSGCLAVVGMF